MINLILLYARNIFLLVMPHLLLGGEERPEKPPSIFLLLLQNLEKQRNPAIRSIIPDELSQFLQSDKIGNFETLCTDIQNKTFAAPITTYQIKDKLHIQSNKYFTDYIPPICYKH